MKHSVFKALNDKEIEEILPYFEEKFVKAGEFIVKEGEYSDIAFIDRKSVV